MALHTKQVLILESMFNHYKAIVTRSLDSTEREPRESDDNERTVMSQQPSVFIQLNDLVSSRRPSFVDGRRSSVFRTLSDLLKSSRRPSVMLISRSRPSSIYSRLSQVSFIPPGYYLFPCSKNLFVIILVLIIIVMFFIACFYFL